MDDKVYKRALVALFDVFEEMCEGAVAVDSNSRIVWINEKYKELLALGHESEYLGKEIESIIPNSLMRQVVETRRPIILDIMDFSSQSFVVTRIPLFDEHGNIIGAVGFVLHDKLDYLRPLVSKYTSKKEYVRKVKTEIDKLRQAKYNFSQIVGQSRPMQEAKRLGRRAAQMGAAVLLCGETGTGKELFAHAIHSASARSKEPFVAINTAAIPENLLEAEFFGVAAGAYTGANPRGRKGKFTLANGGTIFLDEIGDMPAHLQPKLLRVLQDKEFEAVGSNDIIRVDIRIIAATSCDLKKMVEEGKFRQDLYFRLNVFPIDMPSLRSRKEDLAHLSQSLIEDITLDAGIMQKEIASSVLRRIEAYDWPGNVRELRNVLERAVALSDGTEITSSDLDGILPELSFTQGHSVCQLDPLEEQVARVERNAMLTALRLTGGKRAPAAKILGISRASFYDKLKKYAIVYEK